MAIRTIESSLECMSINDENEPANDGFLYKKTKVKLEFISMSELHSLDSCLGVFVNRSANLQLGSSHSAHH